jgi:hypothetical protein
MEGIFHDIICEVVLRVGGVRRSTIQQKRRSRSKVLVFSYFPLENLVLTREDSRQEETRNPRLHKVHNQRISATFKA